MKRRRIYEEAEEATINLTPLIDVVFVVLIMFILVAPLLEQEKVALASSSEKAVSVHQASTLTLHVLEDNTILLNQKKIGLKDLPQHLLEQKRKSPETIPQLFHDKKGYFGTYQAVKNALEFAGYDELDLILKP